MADFAPRAATLAHATTAGNQVMPLAASLGGGWIAAWTSNADGHVYAQRYDAAGARVGAETLVFGDGSSPYVATGVLGLADGSFVVAASVSGGTADSGPITNVVTQRVDASGNRAGAAVTVATSSDGHDQLSSKGIYAMADGGWLVGIEHTYLPPSPTFQSSVAVQRYDAAGNATGGPVTLGGLSSDRVGIALLADGNIVSVTSADSSNGRLLAWKIITPNGTIINSGTMNEGANVTDTSPAVAALPNGNYMLSWIQLGAGAEEVGWQAQVFAPNGTPVAAPVMLEANGYTQMTAVGDGVLVSWAHPVFHTAVSTLTAPRHVLTVEILGQFLDASGNPSGNVMQLVPEHSYDSIPDLWSVAATPDGGFQVTSQRTGDGEDIWQQKFRPVDNYATGSTAAEVLAGTAGSDSIVGLAGNDRLLSNGGNDVLYGGGGADTAVIGASASAVASYWSSNYWVSITTDAGTVTTSSVERFQLANELFAVDTRAPSPDVEPGNVWKAAVLYLTGFGQLPDRSALSQWTAQADSSGTMGELAQRMIDHYAPGISSADLVTYLYRQITDTDPTPQAVQGYVDQIGPGRAYATLGDLTAYAAYFNYTSAEMTGFAATPIQQLDPGWF